MPVIDRTMVERVLAAYEAKDPDAVLAYFAQDGVFIDPHFPEPRMVGHVAIRRGLEWAFKSLEQPGFTLRRLWLDGESGALEVETHHRIRDGLRADFPQVFVFEARNGLLTRLQAYEPYGPHGIQGAALALTRLARRVRLARG
jgi:ketosteroid isomerase-like protein